MKITIKNLSTILLVTTLFVSAISLSSCGAKKQSNQAILQQLDGSWNAYKIKGEALSKEAQHMFVTFNVLEAAVGGRGTCNSFGAPLRATENKEMEVGNIISTRMACSNQLDEYALFGVLNEASRFDIQNGKLFLYNKNSEEPIAEFVRAKDK